MKRFLKKLSIFFKSKYIFSLPQNIELIVFDDTSFQELENTLKKFNYFIIQNRLSNFNKIYLTPKIIFGTLKNYRGNLFSSYIETLIRIVNPKVVFTFIDNSYKFSEIARILHKKIKFVALQNGARYEVLENKFILEKKLTKKNLNKNFFIPYFMCFGNSEIKDYKKNNIKVKKFIKVGCLRLENFLKSEKKIKKNKLKKKYDICLLSDVGAWDKNLNSEKLRSKFALLAKYCIRFSIKFNKKFILVFKRPIGNEGYEEEQNLYKKFLTINEYKYVKKRSKFKKKKEKFGTYRIMRQSRAVVGTMSTLLRENIAIGGKTLACNLTDNQIYNFPIKGRFFIKYKTYYEFEKNISKLLNLSDQKYQRHVNSKSLISNFNTSEIVEKELKNLINS